MRFRAITASLAFAAWIPLASLLVWIWWLGAIVGVAAGWWIARWCDLRGWRGYLVSLGPAALSAGVTLTYSLKFPDATFGSILGQVAAMQFMCALAAFAFVRHVLQPAGQ
jgi:hypothetical protein